jgi:polyhydroxybutyrate depolymerase
MTITEIYILNFIVIIITLTGCDKESIPIDEFYPYANKIDTIRHDTTLRTYKLYVPATYSELKKTALVVALHGYGNTAEEMEQTSCLSQKADSEGFIIVYPNAKNYPKGNNKTQIWNAGDYWEAITGGTDDVGFISLIIDIISKYYNIDQNLIFAAGFSNGGHMTYKLGFELSGKIAAIVPHSGKLNFKITSIPGYKTPILHIHGLEDGIVGYSSFTVDSVLCVWNNWDTDNCLAEVTFENNDYLVKEWPGSANKLYLSKKGRHDWYTLSNSGIEANEVIWDFFKNHPKK